LLKGKRREKEKSMLEGVTQRRPKASMGEMGGSTILEGRKRWGLS